MHAIGYTHTSLFADNEEVLCLFVTSQADTNHCAVWQSILSPLSSPGGEAGSSTSFTQDGGDYLATVFWVVDLNIEALLRRGKGQAAGRMVMKVCGHYGEHQG